MRDAAGHDAHGDTRMGFHGLDTSLETHVLNSSSVSPPLATRREIYADFVDNLNDISSGIPSTFG
jgi:hypothetical protein